MFYWSNFYVILFYFIFITNRNILEICSHQFSFQFKLKQHKFDLNCISENRKCNWELSDLAELLYLEKFDWNFKLVMVN